MNLEQLKNIVREVLDESKDDYEKLFRHMLQRTHKSLKDMDANQKSKFFTALDKAYKAKNEGKLSNLPEELVGNQHKLDTDGDGEIEASDLAALRSKKTDELTFSTQATADAYKKKHKIKPGTYIHVKSDETPAQKTHQKHVDYDFKRMMKQQFGKDWNKK